MRVPHVDIVVPVRNEERDLACSVRRLVAYLRESFPFRARITIADNGSTDATWVIAGRLARELPGVRAVHMDLPGRGRALRAIWSQSEAEVLAYMDVDLSTDLNAPTLAVFKELVAKHEIHYYVGQGSQSFGGGSGSSAIAAWVAAHFTKQTVGGQTVYDLTKPLS